MLTALGVDPGLELDVGPLPGADQPAPKGTAIDARQRRVGHHHGRHEVAQAVVVHDVIGVVVVDLCLQAIEGLANVGLLETQAKALALELAAVHAAPGITGEAVAAAGGELDERVFVGRPAQGDIGVPLVITRRHGVAVAIGVVVGLGTVGHQPCIALTVASSGVQVAVEAPVGTGQQAAVDAVVGLAELLRLALEQHRRRRGTRAPEYGLRALDDGQLVEGIRADIGTRRIHAVGAGAEHFTAIGEQFQTRAEHAAEHRIAVHPAVTHRGETGNGLQVVGAIAGRHRLAGDLRVGDDRQWRLLGNSGDDHGRQFDAVARLAVGGMIMLGGQGAAGEHSQQGGVGELPPPPRRLNRKTLGQARTRRTAMSNAGHRTSTSAGD